MTDHSMLRQQIKNFFHFLNRHRQPISFALIVFGLTSQIYFNSFGVMQIQAGDFQCPWNDGNGSIVIEFPEDSEIFAERYAKSHSKSYFVYKSSNIPSGNYQVELASYDNHSEHDSDQPQYYEQFNIWFGVGSNPDSFDDKAKSGYIDDLPHDQDTISMTANQSLFIPEGVTDLLAVHKCIGDDDQCPVLPDHENDSHKPESIRPVCVKLTPVSTPTPTPSPSGEPSPSPSQSPTPTPTPTTTPTPTPTDTPSPEPSSTPTPTPGDDDDDNDDNDEPRGGGGSDSSDESSGGGSLSATSEGQILGAATQLAGTGSSDESLMFAIMAVGFSFSALGVVGYWGKN